jgi:hypothetical protein
MTDEATKIPPGKVLSSLLSMWQSLGIVSAWQKNLNQVPCLVKGLIIFLRFLTVAFERDNPLHALFLQCFTPAKVPRFENHHNVLVNPAKEFLPDNDKAHSVQIIGSSWPFYLFRKNQAPTPTAYPAMHTVSMS